MALDNETVQTIARLARIEIDALEVDNTRKSLENILDLVAQMEAVDTSGVEPMTHPFDATMRLRADEVSETNQRDKFQAVAPSTERGLYLVPKVIDWAFLSCNFINTLTTNSIRTILKLAH